MFKKQRRSPKQRVHQSHRLFSGAGLQGIARSQIFDSNMLHCQYLHDADGRRRGKRTSLPQRPQYGMPMKGGHCCLDPYRSLIECFGATVPACTITGVDVYNQNVFYWSCGVSLFYRPPACLYVSW